MIPSTTDYSNYPTLLSKSEMARKLCLVSADDRRAYAYKLGRDYFTDDILVQMELTRVQYNRIKVFNRKQTLFIYETFSKEFF
ncbi:MAG: hypothetical protein RIS64_4153 [Bacteroidota bacterium]|jgi:hypothetical protein